MTTTILVRYSPLLGRMLDDMIGDQRLRELRDWDRLLERERVQIEKERQDREAQTHVEGLLGL
jgi:hypothetical protein